MNTPNRAQEFREQLSRRVIVADGAMGTMLYSRGVFINRCFDELNLSQPDLVRQIHQEYVKAGAEILETNTFGANRARLSAFGVAEKLKAINQAGVRLAREAAGADLLILETFGNLDELREAVMAAREAGGDSIPIVAQVTIDDFGHLPGGTDTETFTREMNSWPVDAIGLNCSVGAKATLETIELMMQHSSKPMSAMPDRKSVV